MAILALAALFLASSLSFTAASPGSLNKADPTYVSITPNGVAFIQWTESNGRLTGQIQVLYVDESNPLKLENDNAPFKGVRSGSNLTLTFYGFLSSKTVTGTLRSGKLTLVVPNARGLLVQYVFKAGSVRDYNRAALALRNRVEWQATLVAERRAVQNARAELQEAYDTLLHNTSRLAENTDFTHIFRLYADDWEEMQESYTILRADAAKAPLTCVQLGTVEVDLGRLEVIMGSFEVRNGSFDIVRTSVIGDITRNSRNSQSLQRAFRNLSAAIAADRTKSVPSPSRYLDQVNRLVTEALVRGQKQIQLSNAEIRRAEAQSRDYNKRASNLLQTAKEFVETLNCTP